MGDGSFAQWSRHPGRGHRVRWILFPWSDFLDLAAELASRTGDAAAERIAIGRASYAAFCSARRILRSHSEGLTGGGRDHVSVWDRFHAVPDPVHRRIADRGRRLRRRRNRADYEDVYGDLSRHARSSIGLARLVLADLDSLRGQLPGAP